MSSIGYGTCAEDDGSVLDAIVKLLVCDPAQCGRDGLALLVRRSLRVRGWLDALDAAIAVQAARLAAEGRSADAATVLGGGGRRSRRDAEAAAARGSVCAQLPAVGAALADGRMSAGHVDAVAAAARRLDDEEAVQRFADHAEALVEAAATLSPEQFAHACDDLARNLSADDGLSRQERLRRELELSRLIQTEMLPRGALRSGPAEICGLSIPARQVGGDFFNYFVLPDGRLALLVGDVSGKGVSAALLMANIQATLRARLPHETDLAELADRLDRELEQNTPRSVYLTLFLGILEMDGRTLRYVNAGHNPQFVLRASGGIEPLASTGMPIALYAGHGYRESRVSLDSGDLLFFYTDGLVETENESGDMFGADRLQTLLAVEHTGAVNQVLHAVDENVRAFRGRAEPFDDATMMVLSIRA